MYNPYFGFKENPFNQTPDPDFFFPSEAHKTALDALVYAVKQRKGFVVITGEIGSGKTTVVRTLLSKFDSSIRTALITNTHTSPKGVITLILEDLGISYQPSTKERLLLQLNEFLLLQISEDRNVVVIVDEAQNLNPACIEEIRMLSNLETEKEKLIQIILVGQPELRKKLELSRLEQVRQRVAVHYHIQPLSQEDTKKYIMHRLTIAKSNGQDFTSLFDGLALETIYRYSKGIPRLINHICDHALLAGYVNNYKAITETVALEAIEEVLKFR